MLAPIGSMQARRSGGLGSIDLSSVLVCTRASSAFRQIGAANDGSSAFLQSVGNNVLRVQNRGTRDAILLEGARTNLITRSRAINDAAWTAGNGVTITANVGNGPDGTAVADRLQLGGSLAFSPYKGDSAQVGPLVASMYARATSGTTSIRFATRSNPANAAAAGEFHEATIGTTFQRLEAKRTGTGYYLVPCDTRDYTAFGGTGVIAACDARVDLIQLEVGRFPSSPIVTEGTTATRPADQAYVPAAAVPSWWRTGKWVTTLAALCTSAEFVLHATEMTIFAFGTGSNYRVALVLDSGSAKIRVVEGGSTRVLTAAFTFARLQDVVVTFDGPNGQVTIAGAATGNGTTTGTAWSMQTGDVYAGNTSAVGTPYFGEVLPLIQEAA